MKKDPIKEEDSFAVLEDKPLENDSKDRFGHKEIADSVVEVIKRSPRPFNIGIYGQWGVGKSTICKIVQERLSKEENYKVVYFDTWKYERDSFRRQFLITLDRDLKLGLDFKNRLNQELTETDPTLGEIKFDKRLLFNQLGIISLVIVGVGLLGLISGVVTDFSDGYDLLFSAITSLGLASYVMQLAVNAISRVQISITKSKTDSAEGFEEHFAEGLAELRGKDVLVIIDNLDRLSSEKAVSLLSDIKTFLSDEQYIFQGTEINNKSVFLIPCDNKAINGQLLKEYGDEFDTEEYLRKFFNHSIQIPKFLNIELDDFIIDKLNTTKIPEFLDNYDLVFILSYAFRNNPREIIQFINSFISLYLLAKERKITHVVEKDNIAFLAKVLVLRVKWPRLYEKIEDDILRTGDSLLNIAHRFIEDGEDGRKLNSFLKITSHVNDEEYQDIYFSLRQSAAQRTIPEWNSFIISVLENRQEDALKIYKTIKSSNKLEQLGQLLVEYCRRNRSNDKLLFNVFLGIHKVIETSDLSFFQNIFLLTFKAVGDTSFFESIETIDFNNLFKNGLAGVSHSNKRQFSGYLVTVIKRMGAVESLGRERIGHVKKLFEIISSEENETNFRYASSELAEAKRSLLGHLNYQEIFPDIEKGEAFRRDLLEDVLAVLTSLGPINSRHYIAGLSFISNLLQWAPVIEVDDIRFKVLEKALEFIDKTPLPSAENDTLAQTLNTFSTRISTWYQANKSREERSLCIRIFKKINLEVNPNREVKSMIRAYITETGNGSDDVLGALGKDFIIQNEDARSALIDRSRSTIDLLSKLPLQKELTDAEKAQIFSNLIGNEKGALEFLRYVGYSIPLSYNGDDGFLKGIVQRMISASSFSDVKLLTDWLGAISRLGIQPEHVDSFVQKLRQVRESSVDHKKAVVDFVSKHKKAFGELIVNEFKDS